MVRTDGRAFSTETRDGRAHRGRRPACVLKIYRFRFCIIAENPAGARSRKKDPSSVENFLVADSGVSV